MFSGSLSSQLTSGEIASETPALRYFDSRSKYSPYSPSMPHALNHFSGHSANAYTAPLLSFTMNFNPSKSSALKISRCSSVSTVSGFASDHSCTRSICSGVISYSSQCSFVSGQPEHSLNAPHIRLNSCTYSSVLLQLYFFIVITTFLNSPYHGF